MESTPNPRSSIRNRNQDYLSDLSNPYRKHGKTLTVGEANIVICCYKNLVKEKKGGTAISLRKLQRVVERCAQYTGVDRTTVMRLWKEYKENPAQLQFRTGITPQKERTNNRAFAEYDEADVLQAILEVKGFIRERHSQGTPVTCTEIFGFLREKYPGFPYSQRTVRRFVLHRMGFKYAKLRGKKNCIMENPKYVKWRYRFLTALQENMKKPQDERLHEVYSDESYIWETHARSFSRLADVREDMETCLNRRKWKGPRLIFFHAGGEFGFVPGARLIYKSTKQKGDYHGNIDSDMYEKWFKEKLLPGMNQVKEETGRGCLLILDNAKYHKRSSIPFKPHKANVEELKGFLIDNHVSFRDYWLRADFMKAARKFINKQPTVVEVLAAENGHRVIFQPPYHSEISPIEKVWAQTKYNVAVQYTNETKLDDVKARLEKEFDNYSMQQWVKVAKHCERVRQKQWEQDNMFRLAEDNYVGDGTSELESDGGESGSDVSEGSDAETERDNEAFFDNLALIHQYEIMQKENRAREKRKRASSPTNEVLSEEGDFGGDNDANFDEIEQDRVSQQDRACCVM